MEERIFVFAAHPDDHVLGAGGTIAKLSGEGKKVVSLIFSYGEKSHPWLKEKYIRETRFNEARQSNKILGCLTIFFDLEEFKFLEGYQKIRKELIKTLNKNKPTMIFTHSNKDPHPDHQAVFQITSDLLKKTKFKTKVYTYSIWNPFSFNFKPKFYVDISETFAKKKEAIKVFKSQRLALFTLFFTFYLTPLINGMKIRKKYAEKFGVEE